MQVSPGTQIVPPVGARLASGTQIKPNNEAQEAPGTSSWNHWNPLERRCLLGPLEKLSQPRELR